MDGTEAVQADCGHRTRPIDLRRGLCVSCYRKLRGAGCPLPPKRGRWDDHDALAAWARSLPAEIRARILAALGANPAQSGPPPDPMGTDHCVRPAALQADPARSDPPPDPLRTDHCVRTG